jgi:hypothetical protein
MTNAWGLDEPDIVIEPLNKEAEIAVVVVEPASPELEPEAELKERVFQEFMSSQNPGYLKLAKKFDLPQGLIKQWIHEGEWMQKKKLARLAKASPYEVEVLAAQYRIYRSLMKQTAPDQLERMTLKMKRELRREIIDVRKDISNILRRLCITFSEFVALEQEI